jgi:hypothetical protein
MRTKGVWIVTLPIALAGIEAAHALANLGFGAPHGELFETPQSGAGLLPVVGAMAAAALVCGLAGRVAGVWSAPRGSRAVAFPFVLLPPAGFVLLELAEAFASGAWYELREPAFFAGLLLQLPVAALAYALARALLRLTDELRDLLRGQPEAPRLARLPRARRPADDSAHTSFLLGAAPARAPPATA